MAKYRIISVNGGGVFGAAYARWLSRIAAALPGVMSNTDLFAGTSVGGIIALALASGQSPAKIDSLFSNATAMFTRGMIRHADQGLNMAKWDNDGRTSVLQSVLGSQTLGELPRGVAVNCFADNDKPAWKQATLHNLPTGAGAIYPDSRSVPAWLAGVATSAAPTIFPAVPINGVGYEDGGLAENNPAATALTLATAPFSGVLLRPKPAVSDVMLLSIGLEFPGDSTASPNSDTGVLNSICPVLNKLLTGNASGAIQKCAAVLGPNFFSLTPPLPRGLDVAIDDYDAVGDIQAWADEVPLGDLIGWLSNW